MEESHKIACHSTLYEDILTFMKDFYLTLNAFVLYPKDHPKILQTIDVLHESFNHLLKDKERLIISTIKKDLLFNAAALEKPSQDISRFAHFLYENKISSITFTGQMDILNLKKLMVIISQKSRQKEADYGLMDMINEESIPHINLKSISYKEILSNSVYSQAFKKSDIPLSSPLIEYLMGEAERLTQPDAKLASETAKKPSVLKYLIQTMSEEAKAPIEDLVKMIERLGIHIEKHHQEEVNIFMKNLAEVISSLDPELRLRILGHALEKAKRSKGYIDRSIDEFTQGMIKKVITSLMEHHGDSPTNLLNILKRFSVHPEVSEELVAEINHDTTQLSADTVKTFNDLFIKKKAEKGHTKNYMDKLIEVADDNLAQNAKVKKNNRNKINSYLAYLEEDKLLHQICQIQMEILQHDDKKDTASDVKKGLERNLYQLCQMEDLENFIIILESFAQRRFYLEYFLKKLDGHEMIEEVLLRFHSLPTSHQERFKTLLVAIEADSVRIVVEALAKDKQMVNRKRLLQLLVTFGPKNIPHLIAKLKDERWYLIRNVVLVLGEIRATNAISHIISTLHHPHEAVVKEAIIALDKMKTKEGTAALLAFIKVTEEFHIKIIVRVLLSHSNEKIVISILNNLFERKNLSNALLVELIPKFLHVIKQKKIEAALPFILYVHENKKKIFDFDNFKKIDMLIIETLNMINTRNAKAMLKKIQ